MTEGISELDSLYRRISPRHYVPGENGMRVSSAAYKLRGSEDGFSVNLARMSTPEETLQQGGMPRMGVGELEARIPLGMGFHLKHDPKPDNQAHVLMTGDFTRKPLRAALAEATRIVIKPKKET